MSIAQQPRRVGGAKTRRNTAQVGVNDYDSHEVPVLIRLPDLSAQAQAEEASSQGRTCRHDSAATKSKRKRHSRKSSSERQRRESPDSGVNTKLVVGGVLVGVVVVSLLFFANGGSSDRSDEVAWPDENGEALVAEGGLEVVIPDVASESSPEFNYGLETVESQAIPREAADTMTPPSLADVPTPNGTRAGATADGSTVTGSAQTFLNEEPSTRLFPEGGGNTSTQRPDRWPTKDYSDTASGSDRRSSINEPENEIYRTGRLDQNTSPSGNILDGTIEIPTQTSLR